jgi:hypothetical protein
MKELHQFFPNSISEPFIKTSQDTISYNCIAWAYEDSTKCYWPDGIYFWPDDIPCIATLDNFILLFRKIGYEVCDNGDLENDYEKVAIYCNNFNEPKHAARQLEDGFWTSKLGPYIDVSHTISGMSNGVYGNVEVYMKRKKTTSV